MTPHVLYVANAFHVGAMLLGVPAFIALVPLSYYTLQGYLTKPTPVPPSGLENQPVSLITLLVSGVRAVSKVASFFGDMAQAIITGLAILCFALVLTAVLMFYTAKGLHAHALWARVVAILLSLAIVMISFVGSFQFRLPLSIAMYALFAAGIYSIWALTMRYSV